MFNSKHSEITSPARFFLEPQSVAQRRYEALRAFYVDKLSSKDAAARFGYTPGSFRVLCHQFRKDPSPHFFLSRDEGQSSRKEAKRNALKAKVVQLRKQNLSVYDISGALTADGKPISPVMVSLILKEEGFAKLPRRRDEDRPPSTKPAVAPIADQAQLDLQPRSFRTRFGGLFLFMPWLAELSLPRIIAFSGLPGSKMIPAAHAVRSLLALKLFGNARHTHFMSHVFDEGLGLFAGLNVIPKRSFLTEYSARIEPSSYPKLMRHWFNAVNKLGLERGVSFDLDFHTIPFHGEDAMIQKHYVSKRSRRQKGVLAFLAQDADTRVFCYANAEIRKEEQKDEVLRFTKFWKERTGQWPKELVFDSGLTTYANLSILNERGIRFITLRRRSPKLLQRLHQAPASAWQRVKLSNVSRAYRTPRVMNEKVQLTGYDGKLRQIAVTDLGHEEPTLLLTNHPRLSTTTLVERYARRMLIENQIEDSIDFFHMDALSSAVAMKVNCDLQLTLMASSLYRLLGAELGNGYQTAKSRHIFRDVVDASATVEIKKDVIQVRYQKRAHNPLLLAAGYANRDVRIPWLKGKHLRFIFG